jgi:hypothetical protein
MQKALLRALCGMFTATALTMTAGTALANHRDLLATTVPASSCQPVDSTNLAKVQITNGAWVFKGTETGAVEMWCPLPLNRNTVSDATNNNAMTSYRIWYRDSDGAGAAAQVSVQLTYRLPNGVLGTVGLPFSSNINNVSVDTTYVRNQAHTFEINAIYAFRVRLARTSAAQTTSFTGINFTRPQ